MKNRNQFSDRKKNPELNKPTILAWGILESFISGDDKTDPPKERCPIRSM